jgi:hypothetical protein
MLLPFRLVLPAGTFHARRFFPAFPPVSIPAYPVSGNFSRLLREARALIQISYYVGSPANFSIVCKNLCSRHDQASCRRIPEKGKRLFQIKYQHVAGVNSKAASPRFDELWQAKNGR